MVKAKLSDTCKLLYQAILRLLLVLLHDFPEFLSVYHFSFICAVPQQCVQLRNLILSAFPRNMRLPDPFTPNLRIETLPGINEAPRMIFDYTTALLPDNLKSNIDIFLKSRSPVSFLIDLKASLLEKDGKTKFNVSAINSLVFYVGVHAISLASNKVTQGTPPAVHNTAMEMFQHLADDLDHEGAMQLNIGRYIFLGAIADHLRYSNSHTHYFSVLLLCLFEEASKPIIQEQITRILVERLIVNRPHPYGVLITFVELIRNPRYSFWELPFIAGVPELDALFQSVGKSINSSITRI